MIEPSERKIVESLKQWAERQDCPAMVFMKLNQLDTALEELDRRRASEQDDYIKAYTKGFNDGAEWQKLAKSAEIKI